jgi:hypothetical protein
MTDIIESDEYTVSFADSNAEEDIRSTDKQ